MKVLFVCSGNNKSFDVIPFIKDQGESLKKLGIDIDYFPIKGKGILGYLRAGIKLRQYIRHNKFDLIHAHFILSGWTALIGCSGIPVVLSLMGSDAYGEYIGVNKVKLRSRFLTLLTLLIQPFVKAIISKSKNIENFVYLKNKSYVIPNGINRQKFKSVEYGKNQPFVAPSGKRIVLFLGNKFNVRKNFLLAKASVESLQLSDVELQNPYPISHDEVPYYLNNADVLVVPSLMEGSPNVVKEGMACNCPIVATDIGDVKWVLGTTPGCYVASFNVDDFSGKLKLALEFAKHIGRTNGEQRIEALGLDTGTVAMKISFVYEKVLNAKLIASVN